MISSVRFLMFLAPSPTLEPAQDRSDAFPPPALISLDIRGLNKPFLSALPLPVLFWLLILQWNSSEKASKKYSKIESVLVKERWKLTIFKNSLFYLLYCLARFVTKPLTAAWYFNACCKHSSVIPSLACLEHLKLLFFFFPLLFFLFPLLFFFFPLLFFFLPLFFFWASLLFELLFEFERPRTTLWPTLSSSTEEAPVKPNISCLKYLYGKLDNQVHYAPSF